MPLSITGFTVSIAALPTPYRALVHSIFFIAVSVMASAQSADDLAELRELQATADETYQKTKAERKTSSEGENKASSRDEDAARWVAAGESGYVNCLLTVIGEGTIKSMTINPAHPVPDLKDLAAGNPSLTAWTKQLTFPYKKLSTNKVLSILVDSFELQEKSKGRLKTILVKSDGSPLALIFTAEIIKEGEALKLGVIRPPSP